MLTCDSERPAEPGSPPENSGSGRFVPPPIEVGDRVRTSCEKLGRVILLDGDRVDVQLYTGEVASFRRKWVSYWPDELELESRINRVWHSRYDEDLRRQLALPVFAEAERDGDFILPGSDPDSAWR